MATLRRAAVIPASRALHGPVLPWSHAARGRRRRLVPPRPHPRVRPGGERAGGWHRLDRPDPQHLRLLGSTTERDLPAARYDPAGRYPVAYLLHGMRGSPSSIYSGMRLATVAD